MSSTVLLMTEQRQNRAGRGLKKSCNLFYFFKVGSPISKPFLTDVYPASNDGDSAVSLGDLFHCLTILRV